MAVLARERAKAKFQDWEKKEKEFNFYQSKIRPEIRLHDGRVKTIDILSKHLSDSDVCEFELDEPYMVFRVVFSPLAQICLFDTCVMHRNVIYVASYAYIPYHVRHEVSFGNTTSSMIREGILIFYHLVLYLRCSKCALLT